MCVRFDALPSGGLLAVATQSSLSRLRRLVEDKTRAKWDQVPHRLGLTAFLLKETPFCQRAAESKQSVAGVRLAPWEGDAALSAATAEATRGVVFLKRKE